jgi:nuclear pore complex protein Nup205
MSQAISFLNAHRESLLVILRENQAYLTLKGVEECKLIISMLAMVVHKVPAEDLVRPDELIVEELLMYSALLEDSEATI